MSEDKIRTLIHKVGYKALSANYYGRDKKYTVGETYKLKEEPVINLKGYHFIDYLPLVFSWFDPARSKFIEVSAKNVKFDSESIVPEYCAETITIEKEIFTKEIVKSAIKFIKDGKINNFENENINNKWIPELVIADREDGIASSDHYHSISCTNSARGIAFSRGYGSISYSGSKDYATIVASTSGNCICYSEAVLSIAINLEDGSLSQTDGNASVAIATANLTRSTTNGKKSLAVVTDGFSKAECNNIGSVAISASNVGQVKAVEGSAIVLVSHNSNDTVKYIFSSKVGENGILPNHWYSIERDEYIFDHTDGIKIPIVIK